ncbi:ArsR/SmtB family transcription factor [Micromonospora wenchangensis]|uniref:ArsR/SmtB family transcription factor n=1 Tax=Micromonospora wenchangensis TaxID=1185415 RepID=UPI0037FAF2B0
MTSENPESVALEALRAIAHPVRIQIYELLTLDGPSNVSQVANKINLAVGSASYHLAQLQQAGFIEEATGISVDRRTRWWRAIPGGLNWSPADYLGSASGREVSTSAQRLLTERRVRRLVEWNSSWHQWGKRWIEAAVESDAILQLTVEELSGMTAELSAVVRKWAALAGDASSDAETSGTSASERELVFLLLSAFPVARGR